jgi:hypothetical protein
MSGVIFGDNALGLAMRSLSNDPDQRHIRVQTMRHRITSFQLLMERLLHPNFAGLSSGKMGVLPRWPLHKAADFHRIGIAAL